MRKFQTISILLLVILLLDIAAKIYLPNTALDSGMSVFVAVIAFVCGIVAYGFFGIKSIQGKATLMLVLAILLDLSGNMVFVMNDAGMTLPGTESTILWISGSLMFIGSFYFIAKNIYNKTNRNTVISAALLILLAIFGIFIGNIYEMELQFVMTYVTITFIMVAMALMLFRLGGRALRMWTIIFLGIFVLAAGEVNSMMFVQLSGRQVANLIFDLSSILFAYGFIYSINTFSKIFATVPVKKKR